MELWYTEQHTSHVNFSIKVNKQLYSSQSEFQRIDIFESKEFGRFMTLDGIMMLTEKDEFIYHEMIVHVPMCVHSAAKNVLGGGAILTACCAGFCLIGINPVDAIKFVLRIK